jgi:hypothetical protein
MKRADIEIDDLVQALGRERSAFLVSAINNPIQKSPYRASPSCGYGRSIATKRCRRRSTPTSPGARAWRG